MDFEEVQKAEGSYLNTPMPAYVSHKRVWALKIESVNLELEGVVLTFVERQFAPRTFRLLELQNKPDPKEGMYFVQYEGGYFSFSPADVFEGGYSPAEEEPIIEKITLHMGKAAITPYGEFKTVRVVQEVRWGVICELQMTDAQAVALAKQILCRLAPGVLRD